MASTHIPEEDSKGIDIHTVVIVTREELWRHVDGGPHDAARHHGLWLAETKVCDSAVVVFVQLGKKELMDQRLFGDHSLFTFMWNFSWGLSHANFNVHT